MGNQTVTQGIITDQETFRANQGVEKIALFDANGDPLDLAALQTGEDIPLTGYEIAQAYSAVAPTDTINEAIGKIEAKADSDSQTGADVVLTGYAAAQAYSAVAATDTVNQAIGKLEAKADADDQTGADVVLTGYAIAQAAAAVAATDTLNAAIAKLEKRIYDLENP